MGKYLSALAMLKVPLFDREVVWCYSEDYSADGKQRTS